MIDLIDMKGIVWHDEDRGMSFETVPILRPCRRRQSTTARG